MANNDKKIIDKFKKTTTTTKKPNKNKIGGSVNSGRKIKEGLKEEEKNQEENCLFE